MKETLNNQDLINLGFSIDQINQLIKFSDYKFILNIKPSVSSNNIRKLRKIYKTNLLSETFFLNIINMVNKNIDILKYFDDKTFQTQFNSEQLKVLATALNYNQKFIPKKNFSLIENPSFSAQQMDVLKNIIILDYTSNKNIVNIFNPDVDIDVMRLILQAHKNGIDDDIFYDLSLSVKQLRLLIYAKEKGIDIDLFKHKNLDSDILEYLIDCVNHGYDIRDFIFNKMFDFF